MRYFFHRSKHSADTFILFHGTGGRETDLLRVAGNVNPYFSVFGIRGNVIENGQRRYFKRLKDGSFDKIDLKARTQIMLQFIEQKLKEYQAGETRLHLIGYSNGANMAVNLLLHSPEHFQSAVLLHPSASPHAISHANLSNVPVFITAGATDHIVAPGEAVTLKRQLTESGASVSLFLTDGGHELRESEVSEVTSWWNHGMRI
ncbi:dienelactone hydrolase family protein [Virgibacillus sp. LDC-1]|uniref:alpha/beta hydrolase n=1 Tax=Virgibacillus sp. LDC-1 TaxID=3039856 RepID=UPI0024DE74ED|nr:dienelactone hydrolase family protein [Virgibacillus sp. LDC-1]